MSLLPLSTAWMAVSELAPRPVALYAGVFFLVNATYIALIWELMNGRSGERSRRSGKAGSARRFRSASPGTRL